MPRNPNATNPNAKTAGASIMLPRFMVLKMKAIDINPTMLNPSQYPEKFPATRPDKMFSEAPPSSDEVTISFTWLDSVDVNTFTNSGMMAPANVPQEMIEASFHHKLLSPPSAGTTKYETAYVATTET